MNVDNSWYKSKPVNWKTAFKVLSIAKVMYPDKHCFLTNITVDDWILVVSY
jgi:hypothetical protein